MLFATKAVYADGTITTRDIVARDWLAAMDTLREASPQEPVSMAARPVRGMRTIVVHMAPRAHRAEPLEQDTVIAPFTGEASPC